MKYSPGPLELGLPSAASPGRRSRQLIAAGLVVLAALAGLAHFATSRAVAALAVRAGSAAAEVERAVRLGLVADVLGTLFAAAGFVLLALELRAHARAERAAAERRALVEAILESMSEGVSVVDEDGRIVLVNAARRGAHPPGFRDVPKGAWAEALPFFHPDGHTPVAEGDLPMSRALRGESGSLEIVRRAHDGTGDHYEHTTFRPLRIPGQDAPAGAIVVVRDETERRKIDQSRQEYMRSLQDALADVRTLRGILPICANCKKIRDDEGAWRQVEAYVRDHTDAEFSHGICPDCIRTLYPDFAESASDALEPPER